MATKLPRGIQLVQRRTAEGALSIRYRVRSDRKGVKVNRYFDDLKMAKEYLSFVKMTDEEKEASDMNAEVIDTIKKMELDVLHFDRAIEVYKELKVDPLDATAELVKRRKSNLNSFLKTISQTRISRVVDYVDFGASGRQSIVRDEAFGMLPLEALNNHHINAYIEARRDAGRKKSTIERELTTVSKIIENARNRIPGLSALHNPTWQYDRDIWASFTDERSTTKEKKRLTVEQADTILDALKEYKNPDFRYICELALATAMRRSEIVLLRPDAVDNNNINLLKTKSGKKGRPVFLTDEALEIINKLTVKENGRYFDYTISGFEGSFYKFMNDKLKMPDVTFHRFRKESISRFYERLGTGSTTFLAQFLGIRNVANFEERHAPRTIENLDTEANILKSGGHANVQTTVDHYLVLNKK